MSEFIAWFLIDVILFIVLQIEVFVIVSPFSWHDVGIAQFPSDIH